MSDEVRGVTGFGQFEPVKRKPITLSPTLLVKTSYLDQEIKFPLVIEPSADTVNLVTWAANNENFIEGQLSQHGAIIFRGFKVRSASMFSGFHRGCLSWHA
jgi:hypothetical protein